MSIWVKNRDFFVRIYKWLGANKHSPGHPTEGMGGCFIVGNNPGSFRKKYTQFSIHNRKCVFQKTRPKKRQHKDFRKKSFLSPKNVEIEVKNYFISINLLGYSSCRGGALNMMGKLHANV